MIHASFNFLENSTCKRLVEYQSADFGGNHDQNPSETEIKAPKDNKIYFGVTRLN